MRTIRRPLETRKIFVENLKYQGFHYQKKQMKA
jgi:hypothetical protein